MAYRSSTDEAEFSPSVLIKKGGCIDVIINKYSLTDNILELRLPTSMQWIALAENYQSLRYAPSQ